jgi:mono/diheme cytochrome c family protein
MEPGEGRRREVTMWKAILALGLLWPLAAAADDAEPAAPEEMEHVERFEEGDPARGQPLYQRYCRGCHGVDGRGGAHTFMPHVHNLTQRDYIEFIPDSFLYTVIAGGGVAVGKSSYMPAFRGTLSDEDIKDVIAFVRSLPTY